jgi:tripartite-type tricarboxylate transporter receptor subunit TctC
MQLRFAALLCALALPAMAQTPTVIVTSFGAGSAADIVARLLAPEFTTALGAPFVVKNTTGAAGTIAVNEVVRARPDGLTLLFSPAGPIAIQPSYMRNAGYKTADLAPICNVNEAGLVMMTPANSGLRTLADLLARARAERGQMPYATTGPGTNPHLSMASLNRATGIPMNHITYRGPGDVMVAFQQGLVALMNDHPSSVRANELHAIAVFTPARMPEFPDAPTMKELGYELYFSIWHGLFAPAGTPAPVLDRLEAACAKAVRSPAVITGHERIQTPVVYRDRADFTRFVTAEAERMRVLIEEGGLKQAE